jgi:HSP20 family molecular chaperone IbpA
VQTLPRAGPDAGLRKPLGEGPNMTRASVFSSPLFLGFEQFEELLDLATKPADTFPPHNIERFQGPAHSPEGWRITLAVAGFAPSNLEVMVTGRELTVRGTRQEEAKRDYLHRGIAGRNFTKTFVLADSMEIDGAELKNGLLILTLSRRAAEKKTFRIEVKD